MKKSTFVSLISIAGALVLGAIGLTLIVLHQLGAAGRLANWPDTDNPFMLIIAYGCFIGLFIVLAAFALYRSGMNRSYDLHVAEVRAEREKRQKAATRWAKAAYDAAAMDELLASHPNLRN